MLSLLRLKPLLTLCSFRLLSSSSDQVLLRDYIHHHLYNSESGYFSQHVIIGADGNKGIPEPIVFRSLLDEIDYRLKLDKHYKKVPGSWLTPVEIFSPWYGSSVADYIMERAKEENTDFEHLEIFEIGGGSGTCMVDVLSRIRNKNPLLFNKTKYTCIEISPRLAEAQMNKVKQTRIAQKHWDIICADFLELDERLSQHHDLCFVLAFELLDNLPHDKVVFDDSGSPWEAVIVSSTTSWNTQLKPPSKVMDFVMSFGQSERQAITSSKLKEGFRPATDLLILETLKLMTDAEIKYAKETAPPRGFMDNNLKITSDLRFNKTGVLSAGSAVFTKQGIVYIPTGSLKFLKALKLCVPHHALVLSDFDALPGFVLPGASGPAVQTLGPGNRIGERSSYLLDDISADIFFPTDFLVLKHICEMVTGKKANILSAKEFFEPFPENVKQCQTMSGYCPLIEDYKNTSYLVS